MSGAPDSTAPLRQWLSKADDDLRAAELIRRETVGDHWLVMFHAQQSVEKNLKGLLAHLGIAFRKTHDIADLLELLPKHMRPEIAEPLQESLTYYATTAKTPTLLLLRPVPFGWR